MSVSSHADPLSSTGKKRVADHDLYKDGPEAQVEDNDITSGSIPKASEDVLATRRILKVARKEDGTVDFSKQKRQEKLNPFANVVMLDDNNKTSSTSKPPIFGSGLGFAGFGTAQTTNNSTGGNGFGFGITTDNATVTPSFGFGMVKGHSEAEGSGATVSTMAEKLATDTQSTPSFSFSSIATTAKPVLRLPQDYAVESGEENETILMQCRCRTHRWMTIKDGKSLVGQDDTTDVFKSNEFSAPLANNSTASALSVPPSQDLFATTSLPDDAAATESAETAANVDSNESSDNLKWVEVGIGPMKVLKAKHSTLEVADESDNSQLLRLVQRRESSPNGPATKVLLNLVLWKETQWTQPSDRHVRLSCMTADEGPVIVLFKFKLAQEAKELVQLLQAEIPNAKSCLVTTATTPQESSHTPNTSIHPQESVAVETPKEEKTNDTLTADQNKEKDPTDTSS